MAMFNHQEIEAKWVTRWDASDLFRAQDFSDKPKFYALIEFPYPSGEGLHVGHPRSFTAMDVISRYKRMAGYNVLYPIGFDAFGLPSENYAIKTGIHPAVTTQKNIATFTRQLKSLGISFDWSRVFSTTDPAYYKWTQWIFLQLYKRGLAYKAKMPINWCINCKIGLANEEVVNGKCERCGGPVEKREKEQWMLQITAYADRLIDDLDTVDYLDQIKTQQINWIGRSEGLLFTAPVKDTALTVQTFSAHFEACYADTFVVIAPDHPFLPALLEGIPDRDAISAFSADLVKNRIARGLEKEKELEGIFTGRYIIDPLGNGDLPIWVANFALADYGTGIVKCSAHDERDFAFAKKYNIKLKPVLFPADPDERKKVENLEVCYADMVNGVLSEPSDFAGRRGRDVRQEVVQYCVERKFAQQEVKYKLRDWVFSRQRYWGEPIPMVWCEHCRQQAESSAVSISFYRQDTWQALVTGRKTVETRAVNPEEPERFFGNVGVGHYLEAVNKETGEERYFRVTNVWQFKNIEELYENHPELHEQVWPGSIGKTLQEWLDGYSKNGPEYLNKINKNGLIAWAVEAVIPGWVPLPEDQLPLELPAVEKYQPTDTGESPLSAITDWTTTTCPTCGGAARRETDTMPNWAGSSWYFLRYIDPGNNQALADPEKLKYWSPVDWYNGGMEHVTLHLLYSRFWYKFLYDIGAVPKECGGEPYKKRTAQGMILGEGGEKMSKSRGNVINPDSIVEQYGADTVRTYIMFMGPFDQAIPWDTHGVTGVRRFLEKVASLAEKVSATADDPAVVQILHHTIRKVTDDISAMRFNTAVSALMILTNKLQATRAVSTDSFVTLLKLLAPFAPFITEELWSQLGQPGSVHQSTWPLYDAQLAQADQIEIVVQINGKRKCSFIAPATADKAQLEQLALQQEKIRTALAGQNPTKIIVVPGRLVNIVI